MVPGKFAVIVVPALPIRTPPNCTPETVTVTIDEKFVPEINNVVMAGSLAAAEIVGGCDFCADTVVVPTVRNKAVNAAPQIRGIDLCMSLSN